MLKLKQFFLHPLTITIIYPLILLLFFWWTKEDALFVVVTCYVLGFACITIHELGHVFGGYVVGSKLHFMSAGPILLLPGKQGKFRVALNSDPSMMFGMESSYIPSNNLSNEVLQKKMIPLYLGGPLANLFAIGLSFLVRFMPIENDWLWDITSYFIILNIAIFLATAIPFGGYTDGAKIWELIRGRNMSFYRMYNQYLNPNFKLTAQAVNDDFEQQLNETPQLSKCYNLGLMLIHYHAQNLNYERALQIIDQLSSKLTKEDGPIMENLIYFYCGLLRWASKSDIDEDTLTRIKNINYTYGRSFCYLAEAIIQYAEGKQIDTQWRHLQHSKKWLYQLMDHRQEEILIYAIDSIQKSADEYECAIKI
ncbi:M50 family metallopeptidase [Paenibacillus faecalis]|uniref:M50 family metallopeptidase n=1 Tax=Paenibacillus faecalis TaxID=2079532 RepID=UPI000D0F2032|nr:M50 family metallopeptidase [Paenibacillus faecalis]